MQSLSKLQPDNHKLAENQVNASDDCQEFGANLVFHHPARFLVDESIEDVEMWGEDSNVTSTSLHGDWYDNNEVTNHHPVGGVFDLGWLRDECNKIVKSSTSQLPQDELAMAICRVLDSDKAGDEVMKWSIHCDFERVFSFGFLSYPNAFTFVLKIAGDLLDLVGDSAFETVQDLIMVRNEHFCCIYLLIFISYHQCSCYISPIQHRKELVEAIHHGMLNLKSEKVVSGSQPRMPSYGTQV